MTQSPTSLAEFIIDLSVSIRHAQRDDLPMLEWNREMWGYRQLFAQAYEDSLCGRRLMLIADVNGIAAGRLFVQLCPGNFHYADGVSRGYLYSLHILPMLQGRGIGTQMIEIAEDELRARGFEWVTIAVAVENSRARSLYERLGYEVFRKDISHWTYYDPDGHAHEVNETCWALKKHLLDADLSLYD